MSRPTTTPAWTAMNSAARAWTVGSADVGYMHNQDDVHALACALVGVRLNDTAMIDKAMAILKDAIGTEMHGDWLDVGRNMTAWFLTADILDIRSGEIYDWLASFQTKQLKHENTGKLMTLRQKAWETGTNASCQQGSSATAASIYLRDNDWLQHNWDCFRRICGDTTSPFQLLPNQFGDPWQANIDNRVGIQPDVVINGLNINGAYLDMGRSNPKPVTPLKYSADTSQYPQVSLNALMWAGMMLYRQGFPAFEVGDRALMRAWQFLRRIADDYSQMAWWAADKKEDAKWIAHIAYGLPLDRYPISLPVGPHDQVGWADWIYPTGL